VGWVDVDWIGLRDRSKALVNSVLDIVRWPLSLCLLHCRSLVTRIYIIALYCMMCCVVWYIASNFRKNVLRRRKKSGFF
jgi:hypothetical protein